MNFFEGFHLSGWYNLASLRKVVLTSLTVEVEIIPKTLKGLSENEGHGESGVGGEGGGGGGDWGRRTFRARTIPIRIIFRVCISIARFRFKCMKIIY